MRPQPEGYAEFERLLSTHPDDAWNIAYQAGRDALTASLRISTPEDLIFAGDVMRALANRLEAS